MMLPAKNRIKGNDSVENVKRRGKLFQSENFGVSILKNEDEPNSRFAFVVSGKISKLAVHRNRINRAMHEGVRRVIKEIPEGYDFVFLAKKNLAKKTTDEIIAEMINFFEKLVI